MKKIIFSVLLALRPLGAFQSVDINHASAAQIAELPQVGLKLAKNLVSFREKNGLFSEESELLAVPGMKPNKLKKISDKIFFRQSAKKPPAKMLKPVAPMKSLSRKPVIALLDLEKIVVASMGLGDEFEAAMVSRARRSAMLPKLTLLFDFERDIDVSEKRIAHRTDTTTNRGGRDLGFGIRAVFDLQELIFHKSELELASLALKKLEKREKVLDKLHQLYVRYGHLQEAGAIPSPIAEIDKISSELKETSLLLDSMSKGAFSAYQLGAQP